MTHFTAFIPADLSNSARNQRTTCATWTNLANLQGKSGENTPLVAENTAPRLPQIVRLETKLNRLDEERRHLTRKMRKLARYLRRLKAAQWRHVSQRLEARG